MDLIIFNHNNFLLELFILKSGQNMPDHIYKFAT